MKNLKLFALGLMGAGSLFLTSCADDDNDAVGPVLTVNETHTGSADGSVTVNPGDTLRFEWDARSGDAQLSEFTIREGGLDLENLTTEGGNEIPYDVASGDRGVYTDAVEFAADANEGSTDYVFIIEDEDGMRETETITVVVEGATTDLEDPEPFTWERQGGNDGTGLAMFGLEWTNNTATNAIIATDGATMVMLDPSDWNNITTVEALGNEIAAAIDGGTTINQYTEVSAQQDDTYNDVLGISYNGTYYMLHITNGEVSTSGSGTTITITGEYKAEP